MTSDNEFHRFIERVQLGRQGKTAFIPLPFREMTEYFGVERARYNLITGYTGTGKSVFADQAFVLNPYEFLKKNPDYPVKFKALVWKLERLQDTIAKWTSAYLWQRYRILADSRTLYSYPGRSRLPDDIFQKVMEAGAYFEELFDSVTLIGPMNPTGIYKEMRKFAEQNGTSTRDEFGKETYTPNDPMLVVVVYIDHIGIVSEERAKDSNYVMSKKELMEKTSEYMFRYARDLWGFTPVVTQQMNRGMGDTTRRTKMVLKPEGQDLEYTSKTLHDCDLCFGFLDPSNYDLTEYFGYDIPQLITPEGHCRFRGGHIIKNSYGPDNAMFGLGFFGEIGRMTELHPAKLMNAERYTSMREIDAKATWNYKIHGRPEEPSRPLIG